MSEERKLTISTAPSRYSKTWKSQLITWEELKRILHQSRDTGETMAAYLAMPKDRQDAIKDIGGFVGGALKDGLRRNVNVQKRSLVTLDLDECQPDAVDMLRIGIQCECLIYSTHKSCKAHPRLRLVIPLSRDVTPDEYEPLARKIASESFVSLEAFDPSTYEAARLMYWPSHPHDEPALIAEISGQWIDVDKTLGEYKDWKDVEEWPFSDKEKRKRSMFYDKKLPDPATRPGVIGAFNEAHPIREAIETFLSDVYEPYGESGERYTFKGGSTSGGAIAYNDQYLFSNHATDPARGESLNGFDLVRIHKFGELDKNAKPDTPVNKLPSFKAMQDFALNDEAAKTIMGERLRKAHPEAEAEFKDIIDGKSDDSWMKKLTYQRGGSKYVEDNYDNCTLILENDPNLKGLVGNNLLKGYPELLKKTPWTRVNASTAWSDADDSQLRSYLARVYGIKNRQIVLDVLTGEEDHNAFDPIKEYIESAKWDGEPRIERLLVKYLGADDNEYVRTVTRKMMVAAVARVYEPGKKFDYMVTLVGEQGLGKSLLIQKLGNGWTSDTLPDLRSKQAYESLDGIWLMEMSELVALKKADRETIKNFISKTEDTYRKAYARNVSVNRRRCIFIGTTNDEEFLNDATGARRFLVVDCHKDRIEEPAWVGLKPDEIHQIWAEAKHYYDSGERIMDMPIEVSESAAAEQADHSSDSPQAGMIMNFLDQPIPSDWETRCPTMETRRQWFRATPEWRAQQLAAITVSEEDAPQEVKRQTVWAGEIWVECFGKDLADMKNNDAKAINEIIQRLPEWEKSQTSKRHSIYGTQRSFQRKEGKKK